MDKIPLRRHELILNDRLIDSASRDADLPKPYWRKPTPVAGRDALTHAQHIWSMASIVSDKDTADGSICVKWKGQTEEERKESLDLIKIYFDFRNDFCVSVEFGSYAARNMFP